MNRTIINFNTDWRYYKGNIPNADKTEFQDADWIYVNLPHSTTFYTPENKEAYLGISWYRKTFVLDKNLDGKCLSLTFEAAMQKADVWINGKKVMEHKGGYTPFVIDLEGMVKFGEENIIAVKIDSRPDTSFAPGKTNPDFQYFGGIYGNAFITATNKIHVTNELLADETAGGGIFLSTIKATKDHAIIKVKSQVANRSCEDMDITLLTELLNCDGSVVTSEHCTKKISSGVTTSFIQTLSVTNPRLWSPDTPELYLARTTVKTGDVIQDVLTTTYGIRKVEWKREGLFLNDEKMSREGANLHGETYMFGNAIPDNAIYEEVKRFKEYGFDVMRMAHYPHRPAFYDACDRYGVMVLECASGWQYFNNSTEFKESTYQELRTTIRSHRNHPCIVAWETSLNETNYTAEWAENMNAIAKEEYPENGISYAYTAGCYHWDAWDIGLSTPQAGLFDPECAEGAENPKNLKKPIIIAEYGDWTFGGTYSTTRVTREPINFADKKGGDEGMLIQAGNIEESVTENRQNGENWLGASMYWDYADYAGFNPGILTYCGVVDLYRLPKHGIYFYQSQRSPETDLSSYGMQSGPMVYIANTWAKDADTDIRIYTNCDTVELFLNGTSLGEKRNSLIVFSVKEFESGELKAVAKINGIAKAEHIRRTPEAASQIRLRAESDVALPLDGSSAKLVWAEIVDENGTVVTDSYDEITFCVDGPGFVVGSKTLSVKGGQIGVWVKTKRGTGDITLTASGKTLQSGLITLKTTVVSYFPEVPEGGDTDAEFERFGNACEQKLSSVTREKNASASSSQENSCPAYGSNGVPGYFWYPESMDEEWWMIDTGSIYDLENIQMTWNQEEEHRYLIDASCDQINWTTIVDRSQQGTSDICSYEPVKITARYLRVRLPKGRTSVQGFGLFDAYGIEKLL